MTLPTQQRREFLQTLGLTIGGFLIPLPFFSLAKAVSGVELPREVGQAYLQNAWSGDSGNLEELAHKLKELHSREKIHAFLNQRIEEDFSAGHCFSFQTWVLSRTEGQLCVLSARGLL